jgi:hypothetical protein
MINKLARAVAAGVITKSDLEAVRHVLTLLMGDVEAYMNLAQEECPDRAYVDMIRAGKYHETMQRIKDDSQCDLMDARDQLRGLMESMGIEPNGKVPIVLLLGKYASRCTERGNKERRFPPMSGPGCAAPGVEPNGQLMAKDQTGKT